MAAATVMAVWYRSSRTLSSRSGPIGLMASGSCTNQAAAVTGPERHTIPAPPSCCRRPIGSSASITAVTTGLGMIVAGTAATVGGMAGARSAGNIAASIAVMTTTEPARNDGLRTHLIRMCKEPGLDLHQCAQFDHPVRRQVEIFHRTAGIARHPPKQLFAPVGHPAFNSLAGDDGFAAQEIRGLHGFERQAELRPQAFECSGHVGTVFETEGEDDGIGFVAQGFDLHAVFERYSRFGLDPDCEEHQPLIQHPVVV